MKQIDETWMRFLPIAFSVLKLLRIPGNNYTCMTFNVGLVILNNQLENKKHGYWIRNRMYTNARMNFVIMYGNFITGNLWSYPWINYFGNVCTLVLYFDMLFTLLHVWLKNLLQNWQSYLPSKCLQIKMGICCPECVWCVEMFVQMIPVSMTSMTWFFYSMYVVYCVVISHIRLQCWFLHTGIHHNSLLDWFLQILFFLFRLILL